MEGLFESYYSTSKDCDLKKEEKVFLCKKIKELNEDDKEAIFILIYSYYLNEEGDKSKSIPFEGSKNNLRGIDFNLKNFPLRLRQMCYKFCTITSNDNF